MTGAFPIWAVAQDYILGAIMWTLIGRFGMNIFLPTDSPFFFMRAFVKMTDPIIRLFRPITPDSWSRRWSRSMSPGFST